MPPDPPLEVLTWFERAAFRLVRRMNADPWQQFWFRFQRGIAARWIAIVVGPLLEVQGLEHVRATSRERPLLLVANHRTFFDLYVVMSVLFLRLEGWRAITFPVRGRYFYQRVGGVLANLLAAFWSMYPPFFHEPGKRRFDQWALGELAELCRAGPGRLVGFHPEGTRNRNPDPWSLLPGQPGIGRLIFEARPQVVPVFLTGLDNSFLKILGRRWRGGEPIRLRFGRVIEYQPLVELPGEAATYRALSDRVMQEIRRLAAADREQREGREVRSEK